MRTRTLSLLALSIALLAGCEETSRQKITITGSSTIAPLIAEIAKRYEARHPDIRIDVQTGGSSRGINDPVKGLADVGMSSRALRASESDGRVTHVLARDGVAFIVHASNPISELTDEQILGIFTGKFDNWEQVGGNDGAITSANRANGRSELELMMKFYELHPEDFQVDLISGENQHGIKTVAGDPNAITYMSIGASEFDIANGVPIKLLPLRGVPASSKSVASEQFPLSRPLILITTPEPLPHVSDFIEFARSESVHDLIRQQSYVPLQ
ncbi:MAG: phosphate ABC transporter substrate-binding protein [Verrucomicrobiota bacterium]